MSEPLFDRDMIDWHLESCSNWESLHAALRTCVTEIDRLMTEVNKLNTAAEVSACEEDELSTEIGDLQEEMDRLQTENKALRGHAEMHRAGLDILKPLVEPQLQTLEKLDRLNHINAALVAACRQFLAAEDHYQACSECDELGDGALCDEASEMHLEAVRLHRAAMALAEDAGTTRIDRDTQPVLPSREDQPWPTYDAIERLCGFAEVSLSQGYDGHGYEELGEAARVVRSVLEARSTLREPLHTAADVAAACEATRTVTNQFWTDWICRSAGDQFRDDPLMGLVHLCDNPDKFDLKTEILSARAATGEGRYNT